MRPDLPACAAWTESGSGIPLVFIHGVGMNRQIWTPQISEFARDFRVIAYDMLGHGDSPLPPADPTLEDYAQQLDALLDALGIPAAHVIGHSMGALVALEFALTRPARCLSVSALNAVFCRSPEQRAAVQQRAHALGEIGSDTTIRSTLARWFGEPVPPALKDSAELAAAALRAVNPVGYARSYQLFARADEAHAQRLSTLEMPALFMTGQLDPNSSPGMSMAMAALAPDACVDILPGERHMMCLCSPVFVNARLRVFIESVVQRGVSTPRELA